jgi:RHS repeat-associated protein
MHRLETAQERSSAGALIYDETFAYDLGGTLLRKGSNTFDTPVSSAKPHMLTRKMSGATVVETYAYDARGSIWRVTNGSGGRNISITYDDERRVSAYTYGATVTLPGTTISNRYNAMGGRVRKTVTSPVGVSTVDHFLTPHYQLWGGDVVKFYWMGDQLVARRHPVNGASTLEYGHQDHLGSTKWITKSDGTLPEEYKVRYEPYGRRISGTVQRAPAYAQQLEDKNDLMDMGARSYDPTMGRFLQVDPKLLSDSTASSQLSLTTLAGHRRI